MAGITHLEPKLRHLHNFYIKMMRWQNLTIDSWYISVITANKSFPLHKVCCTKKTYFVRPKMYNAVYYYKPKIKNV